VRALLSVLALAISLPAWAGPADPWTIDPANSRIAFTVEQLGKLVSGRIGSWTGTIVLEPGDLAAARIDIRMDMRTARAGT
jgi:polyisoprenoid-binding protein YceI